MQKTFDNKKKIYIAVPARFAGSDILSPADVLRTARICKSANGYLMTPYKEGAKIVFHTKSYRITVNRKTGLTYFFSPIEIQGNGFTRRGRGPRLLTATSFFTSKSSQPLVRKYMNLLSNPFVKESIGSIVSGDFGEYVFSLKYPYTLTPTKFLPAFRMAVCGVNRQMEPARVYEKMAANLRLRNTPSFRRTMTDTDMIGQAAFMKYIGFRNQNIIINAAHGRRGMKIESCGHTYTLKTMKKTRLFFKEIIRQKGEPAASKLFIPDQASPWLLYDTIKMYSSFREHNEAVPLGGSLADIHDFMALNWRRLKHDNLIYSYTDQEKQLEDEIDGYRFQLPIDSYSLAKAGSSLSNCVGSYGKAVQARQSLIVLVKKDREFAACIELSPNRCLRQAKGRFNEELTGHLAEAVLEWIDRKEVNGRNCYDYERMLVQLKQGA